MVGLRLWPWLHPCCLLFIEGSPKGQCTCLAGQGCQRRRRRRGLALVTQLPCAQVRSAACDCLASLFRCARALHACQLGPPLAADVVQLVRDASDQEVLASATGLAQTLLLYPSPIKVALPLHRIPR